MNIYNHQPPLHTITPPRPHIKKERKIKAFNKNWKACIIYTVNITARTVDQSSIHSKAISTQIRLFVKSIKQKGYNVQYVLLPETYFNFMWLMSKASEEQRKGNWSLVFLWNSRNMKKKTFKKSQHYKTAGIEDTLVHNSNNRLQLHEASLNHA